MGFDPNDTVESHIENGELQPIVDAIQHASNEELKAISEIADILKINTEGEKVAPNGASIAPKGANVALFKALDNPVDGELLYKGEKVAPNGANVAPKGEEDAPIGAKVALPENAPKGENFAPNGAMVAPETESGEALEREIAQPERVSSLIPEADTSANDAVANGLGGMTKQLAALLKATEALGEEKKNETPKQSANPAQTREKAKGSNQAGSRHDERQSVVAQSEVAVPVTEREKTSSSTSGQEVHHQAEAVVSVSETVKQSAVAEKEIRSEQLKGFWTDANGQLHHPTGRFASKEEKETYNKSQQAKEANTKEKEISLIGKLVKGVGTVAEKAHAVSNGSVEEATAVAAGGSFTYAAKELFDLGMNARDQVVAAKDKVGEFNEKRKLKLAQKTEQAEKKTAANKQKQDKQSGKVAAERIRADKQLSKIESQASHSTTATHQGGEQVSESAHGSTATHQGGEITAERVSNTSHSATASHQGGEVSAEPVRDVKQVDKADYQASHSATATHQGGERVSESAHGTTATHQGGEITAERVSNTSHSATTSHQGGEVSAEHVHDVKQVDKVDSQASHGTTATHQGGERVSESAHGTTATHQGGEITAERVSNTSHSATTSHQGGEVSAEPVRDVKQVDKVDSQASHGTTATHQGGEITAERVSNASHSATTSHQGGEVSAEHVRDVKQVDKVDSQASHGTTATHQGGERVSESAHGTTATHQGGEITAERVSNTSHSATASHQGGEVSAEPVRDVKQVDKVDSQASHGTTATHQGGEITAERVSNTSHSATTSHQGGEVSAEHVRDVKQVDKVDSQASHGTTATSTDSSNQAIAAPVMSSVSMESVSIDKATIGSSKLSESKGSSQSSTKTQEAVAASKQQQTTEILQEQSAEAAVYHAEMIKQADEIATAIKGVDVACGSSGGSPLDSVGELASDLFDRDGKRGKRGKRGKKAKTLREKLSRKKPTGITSVEEKAHKNPTKRNKSFSAEYKQGGKVGAMSKLGAGVKTLAKGGALAGLFAGVDKIMDVKDRDDLSNSQKGAQVASTAIGAGGGAAAGGMAGAALGTMILPGIGTAVGGVIGSMLGGMGGESIGSTIGESISDFMASDKTLTESVSGWWDGLTSSDSSSVKAEAGDKAESSSSEPLKAELPPIPPEVAGMWSVANAPDPEKAARKVMANKDQEKADAANNLPAAIEGQQKRTVKTSQSIREMEQVSKAQSETSVVTLDERSTAAIEKLAQLPALAPTAKNHPPQKTQKSTSQGVASEIPADFSNEYMRVVALDMD